jgi:hypothetical protein
MCQGWGGDGPEHDETDARIAHVLRRDLQRDVNPPTMVGVRASRALPAGSGGDDRTWGRWPAQGRPLPGGSSAVMEGAEVWALGAGGGEPLCREGWAASARGRQPVGGALWLPACQWALPEGGAYADCTLLDVPMRAPHGGAEGNCAQRGAARLLGGGVGGVGGVGEGGGRDPAMEDMGVSLLDLSLFTRSGQACGRACSRQGHSGHAAQLCQPLPAAPQTSKLPVVSGVSIRSYQTFTDSPNRQLTRGGGS